MVKTLLVEFTSVVLPQTKQYKCATDDVGEIACAIYPKLLCNLTCKNDSVYTEKMFSSVPYVWDGNGGGLRLFTVLAAGKILELTSSADCVLRIDYDSPGTLVAV